MEIYNGTYCVYIHTNKINGKMYVGQTGREPKTRWGKKGGGYKRNPRFYSAIKHYGWDNFEHEIIASHLTKEEADNFEKILIKELGTMNPDKGYNLTKGGEGLLGYVPSEERRRKLSEFAKTRTGEKNPNWGNHPTSWCKGKTGIFSEETIIKLKIAAGKPIMCIETGVEYFSAKEACVGYANIKRAKNKPNCTAGGLHWRDVIRGDITC